MITQTSRPPWTYRVWNWGYALKDYGWVLLVCFWLLPIVVLSLPILVLWLTSYVWVPLYDYYTQSHYCLYSTHPWPKRYCRYCLFVKISRPLPQDRKALL